MNAWGMSTLLRVGLTCSLPPVGLFGDADGLARYASSPSVGAPDVSVQRYELVRGSDPDIAGKDVANGRNAVYQLAALTIGARLAVADA
jgi:hypothetical protein